MRVLFEHLPVGIITTFLALGCGDMNEPLLFCPADAPGVLPTDNELVGRATDSAMVWLEEQALERNAHTNLHWDENGWIDIRVLAQRPPEWKNTTVATATHIVDDQDWITYCVIRLIDGDYNDAIIAHELGHCMGLEHERWSRSIMHKHVSAYTWLEVSERSAEWLRKCQYKRFNHAN